MKNDRKRPLTPEEKTECEALKAIWELKKKGLGITQEGAGEKLGMSQAAVSHYLNARTALNLPVASQFAKLLRCSISDFSPRLEAEAEAYFTKAPAATTRTERESEARFLGDVSDWDDSTPLGPDEVQLPFLKDTELAAGNGHLSVAEDRGHRLRFARSTLRKLGVDPANAVVATLTGNSGEPVLPHGSTIAIDRGNKRIVDGKLYALDHGGMFRVKQLYRLPGGGLRLRSYNRDEHPDEDLSGDQVKAEVSLIGRVFWYAAVLA